MMDNLENMSKIPKVAATPHPASHVSDPSMLAYHCALPRVRTELTGTRVDFQGPFLFAYPSVPSICSHLC